MRRLLLALCLGLVVPSSSLAAPAPRPFLDLGFEARECTSGWLDFSEGGFEILLDGSVVMAGSYDAVIWVGSTNPSELLPFD